MPFIDSYVTLVRDNANYRHLWLSQVISQLTHNQSTIPGAYR